MWRHVLPSHASPKHGHVAKRGFTPRFSLQSHRLFYINNNNFLLKLTSHRLYCNNMRAASKIATSLYPCVFLIMEFICWLRYPPAPHYCTRCAAYPSYVTSSDSSRVLWYISSGELSITLTGVIKISDILFFVFQLRYTRKKIHYYDKSK